MKDSIVIEDTGNRNNSFSNCTVDEMQISQLDELDCLADNLEECHDQDYKFISCENKILQFDGIDDCSDDNVDQNLNSKLTLDKAVFGINCEEEDVIHLINFLRSFNFVWIALKCHSL